MSSNLNLFISGAVLGLFGLLLMHFSFPINNLVVADFRQLAIIVSVYLGGAVSGFWTMLIIAVYRLFFLHGLSSASIFGALNAIATFLVAVWLMPSQRKFKARKGILVLALSLILALVTFYLTLHGNVSGVLVPFSLLFTLAGTFTYYLLRYLKRSDELLHRMKEAAHRDFLTGLHNPRAFKAYFDSKVEASYSEPEVFSLLVVDIDHFKRVNDTYGHAAGDAVLSQLANVLRDTYHPGDYIARKGGEEFVVILDDCGAGAAGEAAERLRRNVENHVFVLPEGESIRVTVSIGASAYPEIEPGQLFEKADQALYAAKQAGRNQVCLMSA
ncbi:diguanylate cyclase [Paenibacillus sp. YPG26]|uniref:GGDEF domain-containing protein n=1 Tax=Paenibacillus sp. YPG26 TaxID=2878915 RepID=UPI00203CD384|nr:diguanylate cyclase [Paenibacillus sp. YPG26]USB33997.1 diguanylate cyclase [Paenibacillus sp. YPG26]